MFKFWTDNLDPVDMLSEAIYGVLIVMTFTMAVHIFNADISANPSTTDARSLFVAAIGCAIAWAFIDAVIYVLTSLAERVQSSRFVRTVQTASNREQAVKEVVSEVEERMGDVAGPEERQRLATAIVNHLMQRKPHAVRLRREDLIGACALFTVAVVGTLPVAIPLLFVSDPALALRLSNVVSIAYLFGIGYFWGKNAGARPLLSGSVIALIGTLLVLIAVPLGG